MKLRNVDDVYPLSEMQQGLLFHSLSAPGSGTYIEQVSWEVREEMDSSLLREGWRRAVAQHSILRTAFFWKDLDEPLQTVRKTVALPWAELDWSDRPGPARRRLWEALLKADRRRGFDPSQAPLMRLTEVRLGEHRRRFLWSYHHLLLDGWSVALLLREVFQNYQALQSGREPQGRITPPFRDYIAWLRGQDLTAAQQYWQALFHGYEGASRLPLERFPMGDAETAGQQKTAALEIADASRLKDFARRRQTTLSSLVHAAWACLLYRCTAESDLIFGSVAAGRPTELAGFESMIGLFINTLPFRIRMAPRQTAAELLKNVHEQQLGHRRFEHCSLKQVQRWSGLSAGQPLFETLLAFDNAPIDAQFWASSPVKREDVVRRESVTGYPLTLEASAGDALELKIVYAADRFDGSDVRRLLRHLSTLVDSIVRRPDSPIGQLPMLSDAQRHQLTVECNPANAISVRESLHQLFEKQAIVGPDAIALTFENQHVTYQALNQRANRLANRLLELQAESGINRTSETRIGICLPRSFEQVVAQLAILKTGSAYVPIDPSYPRERIEYLARDSGLNSIVTLRSLSRRLPRFEGSLALLDEDEALAGGSADDPAIPVDPEQTAYVIYTSGSTGRPKGVQISHANVVRLLRAARKFGFGETDVWTLFHSESFDVSVWEIWGCLLHGGRLVIVPYWQSRSLESFLELLSEERVTVLNQTPSAFYQLIRADEESRPELSLRWVILAGEALEAAPLGPWVRRRGLDRPALVNMYGITETTVHATFHRLTPAEVWGEAPVLVGRPLPDLSLHLLDAEMNPVPIGAPGEIHVGGAGLSQGYLHRPALTAQRFVPDPFGSKPGARLYRSGDLGVRLSDGTIRSLGRIDDQFKIRGFRIEPGEVEWVINQHPKAAQSAALKLTRPDGSVGLAAFVVGQQGAQLTAAELREHLAGRLPEHMIPSPIVPTDAIPLTPHGKIDRRRLLAEMPQYFAREHPFAPPANELEEKLAQIWAELLNVERIGRDDHFFELGGDSILSMQLAARARRIGLAVSPRDVFESPTLAGLAAAGQRLSATRTESTPAPGPLPLTPIQRWFFQLQPPRPNHFNQSLLLEVASDVHPRALSQSFKHLSVHHDSLRLRFSRVQGEWRQRCGGLEDAASPLMCIDLSELPSSDIPRAFDSAADQLQAGLDIERGPLLRAALFFGRTEARKLLITVHHLAVDAVSWRILLEDLQTVYRQALRGRPLELPPRTASYQDWALHLQGEAQSESEIEDLPFWLETLRRTKELPCDRRLGANNYASARSVGFQLAREETGLLLRDVHRAYRTRTDEFLLAALLQGFFAWTGDRSLVLNFESHGRDDSEDDAPDLSRTVGWLTRIFPVALTSEAPLDPGSCLKAVKEQFREALGRSRSFGLLRFVNAAAAAHFEGLEDPSVSFNYAGQYDSLFSQSGWLKGAAADWEGKARGDENPRPHLLEIDAGVVAGRLRVVCAYSENFHRRSVIEDLTNSIQDSLRRLIAHCLEEDAGGPTPSDFPLVRLDQAAVDRLNRQIGNLTDVLPLTPMQEGMLFHSLQNSADYFEQLCVWIRGPLDRAAFRQAWRRLVERHPALRSCFLWKGLTDPVQTVRAVDNLQLRELDWSSRPSEQHDADLQAFLLEDRRRGFDLAEAPLMRLTLVQTSPESFVMVWSYHHLLADGWSVALLLREVFLFYAGLENRSPIEATAPPPYANYLRWLKKQDLRKAANFWRDKLEGFQPRTPSLPPPSRQRSLHEDSCGEEILSVDAALTGELTALARRRQVTLNTVILGAWTLALGVYSASREVATGVTVSGRPADLSGSERMVGVFINTLPLRTRIPWESDLQSWLLHLQEAQNEINEYAYSPLPEVQRWSGASPGTPLFETIYVFENYPRRSNSEDSSGPVIERVQQVERTDYPLMLVVVPDAELRLKLLYDRRRFGAPGVASFLKSLKRLLEGMLRRPQARLADLPYLTTAQRHLLLTEWNDTVRTEETPLFPARFKTAVQKYPDRPAVVMGPQRLTYRDLDERSSQLARYLQDLGAGPEQRIPVCLDRSLDLVTARLGVLKAGAAYVPLDPETPPKRLAYMVEATRSRLRRGFGGQAPIKADPQTHGPTDPQTPIVVTHRRWLDRLPDVRAVCLDRDWPAISRMDKTPPATTLQPNHLAYMVYTSGSTGRPKAVEVEHAGFANLVDWHLKAYRVVPTDRKSQFSGLAFDASVWELWPYLAAGAGVHFSEKEILGSWDGLRDWLESERITLCFLPTPLAEAVLEEVWPENLALRALLTGGDQLHAWPRQDFPFAFVNKYGPTEVSAVTTWAPLNPAARRIEPPPIGRPIANTFTYVLDSRLRPVPIGVPGDLYIGGVGVARGYHGDPALTAENFLPDPYSGVHGARMYRSGDRVRFGWDGNLEFLGRHDRQVKIRGFRVELGEVEAVLRRHPRIREAAVVTFSSAEAPTKESRRLAAYVTARGKAPDLSEVQEFCRDRLPRHMWPQVVVPLKELPLTPNGKIDRKALPALSEELFPARAYRPAETELEKTLARIWADVLHRERVGVDDNFFDLGGDSIRSVRIVAQAAGRGIQLTPQDLFNHQSIAEIADALGQRGVASAQFSAAPYQQLVARITAARPEAAAQWVFLEFLKPVGRSHLRRALRGLIQEHEALRLRFRQDAPLRQWVDPAAADSFEATELDLSALSSRQANAEMDRVVVRLGEKLAFQGPPVKAVSCRLAGGKKGLLLIAHALVMDASSWSILIRDLDARLHGPPWKRNASRPFTEWLQQESHRSADADSAWRATEAADVCWVRLGEESSRLLETRVCRAFRTTIEAALLAAVHQARLQIEGRRPLEAELHLDARRMEERFAETVGCLRRIAAVRLDFPAGTPIGGTLRRIKEKLVAARGDPFPTPQILLVQSCAFEDFSSPFFKIVPERSRPDFPLTMPGGRTVTAQWKMTEFGLAMGWSGVGGAERIRPLAEAAVRMLEVLVQSAAGAAVKATPADFPEAGLDSAQMESLLRDLERKGE